MVTCTDFRRVDADNFKTDMANDPRGNINAVNDDDIDNKVIIFENTLNN